MIAPVKTAKQDKVGAVMVVGGGIAGIQAALDLAESGLKVYLVERSPAIGGNMARLDKTFPTNDCSMCILSPKIVECGRHLNIEVIPWTDVEALTGEAGRFRATLRRRARYVDVETCTGCGDCVAVCPIKVDNEFDAAVGQRAGIFRPCPQAYPTAFVIDKRGKSPCRAGCPAGININAYVALAAAGRFDEALDTVLDTVPLAGVLGRVCDHPCETECQMRNFGDPVAICSIKRFLADRRRAEGGEPARRSDRPEQTLEKVAIIGGGPAGLTAARELARLGYRPTILEATDKAGGMLAWGIPDYRLPPDVLAAEVQDILDEGVELRLNTRLGRDLSLGDLAREGVKATVLAIGAQTGSRLGIDGEDLQGVTDCIAFLYAVNSGQTVPVGRNVTIIGGGNSAIDSARTALRLGAETVTVVYRRTRAEMPAIAAEVLAAEEEGIRFHYLASPVHLAGADGRVCGLTCVKMELGEPDESGRFRPTPIEGSEFTIDTDMVISGIGQKVVMPDDDGLKDLELTRWGTIDADATDASTRVDGVFAIGDAVSGPASVIEAIAEGRKAAARVDAYLRGKPFEPIARVTHADVVPEPPIPDEHAEITPRQRPVELDPTARARSFDEVEATLTEEQVVAEAQRCLQCAVCSECMACVEACKAQAIHHDDQDRIEQIDVGAVIALPGFDEFMARLTYDYGYSRFDDVISSMQFERILSASGPFGGHVQRPSDGQEPRRIAFLQCVGSRDVGCRNAYCSSVCCMYAIKEAVIAKEHLKDVDVTVFFMDMRAFGKDFERYYERAKSEYGVQFVRARVSDVARSDGQLRVQYSPDDGGVCTDDFDLVVLSVGLEPAAHTARLADTLGVRTRPDGFVWTAPDHPLRTSRAGVFVGGAASGPKDIPETVTQASGAACEAGRLLADTRHSLTVEREYPPERDVTAEPPRVGVFVCHCGINIGSVVNVPGVADYARELPNVAYAEENLYTCSQDSQQHIREMIVEHNLNRVVVASCSPRTHEPLFQQTLREAGLNAHLFEMANIRDQCSWIHQKLPDDATRKARDLVRMAVAKVALVEPLQSALLDVTHSALVIGGGLAGMTAALAIADQGFDVSLVERQRSLGGNLKALRHTFEQPDVRGWLKRTVADVQHHPRITVHTGARLENVEGFVGNFTSTVRSGGEQIEIKHGVIVVATGGAESKPTEYGYGPGGTVLTQLELEDRLYKRHPLDGVETVVMIQCVGSREPDHMYCSRTCCATAVKNALKIKELSPDTEVYVLYRDMRTYGLAEAHYRAARDKGVVFVRYELDAKPVVSGTSQLTVRVREPMLDRQLELHPDLLVLSSRIDPTAGAEDLGQMLKVPLNADNFFLEAHVKLRPVEFATEGIFVAGLAHGPKTTAETVAQAQAAAAKACTVLSKDQYEAEPTIAALNEDLCDGCGICVPVCEYNALEIIDRPGGAEGEQIVRINEAMCKGCGGCVAACPSGAMEQKGFKNNQMLAMIEAALVG